MFWSRPPGMVPLRDGFLSTPNGRPSGRARRCVSRLAMVFDGNIIGSNFEDLNVVNKFDAIVMNPPFGTGGKTAVDHLAKAATHLRDGGRIVALLPTGPAADKRLDKVD